mmetsp:Transcript_65902/g.151096  ORF Transcript_65902/g.151096 Transcript_65902/m.151096 type:complete len:317 (+) Transcript_65902:1081-2031(+)
MPLGDPHQHDIAKELVRVVHRDGLRRVLQLAQVALEEGDHHGGRRALLRGALWAPLGSAGSDLLAPPRLAALHHALQAQRLAKRRARLLLVALHVGILATLATSAVLGRAGAPGRHPTWQLVPRQVVLGWLDNCLALGPRADGRAVPGVGHGGVLAEVRRRGAARHAPRERRVLHVAHRAWLLAAGAPSAVLAVLGASHGVLAAPAAHNAVRDGLLRRPWPKDAAGPVTRPPLDLDGARLAVETTAPLATRLLVALLAWLRAALGRGAVEIGFGARHGHPSRRAGDAHLGLAGRAHAHFPARPFVWHVLEEAGGVG